MPAPALPRRAWPKLSPVAKHDRFKRQQCLRGLPVRLLRKGNEAVAQVRLTAGIFAG